MPSFELTHRRHQCILWPGAGQIGRTSREAVITGYRVGHERGRLVGGHPDLLRHGRGQLCRPDLADASVAGLLAWWSLIHLPDDAVPTVFGHFRRALRPGGPLLLGFHVGDQSRLKTQGYGGHVMKVHVHRRQPDQVAAWLRDAGFTVEAHLLLDPDENVPGAVLFARRQS